MSSTSSPADTSTSPSSSSSTTKSPPPHTSKRRPSVPDFFEKFQKAIHIGQKTKESRFAARRDDWRRWANPGGGAGSPPVGRRADANQFDVPGGPWEDGTEEEEDGT
ncbi:hypothetical protein HO173_013169 [Letharia columbiana]|uniref:Uncharacterized protein n=1 Tax=Letharia columbiana TaxID=112416 RepID=A0A8H6CI29_9LECA|nr:uncharacterized protein HO173_013169 [Letharia columbiana]KAF6223838.1 hypothetical protein HO173_013169 [Letharia columbiana]